MGEERRERDERTKNARIHTEERRTRKGHKNVRADRKGSAREINGTRTSAEFVFRKNVPPIVKPADFLRCSQFSRPRTREEDRFSEGRNRLHETVIRVLVRPALTRTRNPCPQLRNLPPSDLPHRSLRPSPGCRGRAHCPAPRKQRESPDSPRDRPSSRAQLRTERDPNLRGP